LFDASASLPDVRVLFCCRPAYGHVYPLLPLAAACRDAGHEVLFGTGEGFVKPLRRRGFRAERVGISIDEADRRALEAQPELNDLPREERWRFGLVVFAGVLPRQTIADLHPLLDEVRPDLLVYDETDIGAPVTAELAGVPAVAHSLGRQLPGLFRQPALEALTEVVRTFEPAAAPRDPFFANAYLDICPPSLRDPSASDPAERIPLRPVAPVDPGDAAPAWVSADRSRPLAYLTLGTYVSGYVDSLRAAAVGLGSLDLDTLVTIGPSGDPAALERLPDSVRVERFVPQGVLFGHLDVVVHHGGSGTMLGALARGLPQLVLPHGADQFMNAQALLDSGAGLRLLPEEISADAVAEAVRAVLDESRFRDAAGRIGAEIAAMPAPADVVADLERLRLSG
jgi:UDP:flavonoid glycosyltransferase YjiC (YdhE family)